MDTAIYPEGLRNHPTLFRVFPDFKDRSELVQVKRPMLARALDYISYCPIMGGLIAGALRIIGSVAIGCLHAIGAFYARLRSDENLLKRRTASLSLMANEFGRGILECLFTVMGFYWFDSRLLDGVSGVAHGKHAVYHQQTPSLLLYSKYSFIE